jgi:mRNA interferase MazF
MNRGEVWWARAEKRRPVVLCSRPAAYDVRSRVIVAPVTTLMRGGAVEVWIGREAGLPQAAVVNCDELVTMPKADLIEQAGVLSSAKVEELDRALRFALGLDTPP